MGWLLDELKALAGPDAEPQIRTAARRARQRFEPWLRELTGLRLRTSDADQVGITVEINPGLPEPLKPLDLKPDELGLFLLGVHLPDFDQLIHSTEQLKKLMGRMGKLGAPWTQAVVEPSEAFDRARQQAAALREQARSAALLPRLLQYDSDVLGDYRNSQSSTFGTITLYWAVIGAVARTLGCSIEALTAVVLVHELAHGYAHLGANIEGRRWSTEDFFATDLNIHITEGLAQYYTHLVTVRMLRANEPEMFRAYRRLLRFQAPPYRAHRQWLLCKFTPEVARAALIEFRLANGRTLSQFEELLNVASKRLLARPDKLSLL